MAKQRSFTKNVEIDGHKITIIYNSKLHSLELTHNDRVLTRHHVNQVGKSKLHTAVFSIASDEEVRDFNYDGGKHIIGREI